MLDNTASEDNHSALLGLKGTIIEQTNVLHEINNKARLSPCLEVDDISESSVSEGRAEDIDIVLPAPVVDAVLIVNLLTDAGDNLRGCENGALILLLLMHLFDKRQEPLLKQSVVLVGDDEVADTVQTLVT